MRITKMISKKISYKEITVATVDGVQVVKTFMNEDKRIRNDIREKIGTSNFLITDSKTITNTYAMSLENFIENSKIITDSNNEN